ncbi:hypothetical protein [Leptolyngbya sp. GGD]|uniref:hypothetical protein n=1 Tax=Leptolyngbya sp. GGD TaxID=2997907 RepID=UPI00227BCD93|nr:hypothetical protein [Leptolyngbya sp. GGD]MCY6490485.1 hypothetical protein [Leptolyngbya sp. GGD]
MEKYANLIFASFSSAISIRLLPFLEKIVQPNFLALAIACIIGALTFGILNFLIDLPKRFKKIRLLLDPIHGIEGYWFEEVENTPDHPYSYAWIEWNHTTKSFRYRGINFNQDLTVNARWRSRTITINKSEEKIDFLFEATVISNRQNVEGYGTLEFFNPISGHYHGGTGDFVDSGTKTKRYTLKMERIEDDFVKKLIGRKEIKNEDEVRFIIKEVLKFKQA